MNKPAAFLLSIIMVIGLSTACQAQPTALDGEHGAFGLQPATTLTHLAPGGQPEITSTPSATPTVLSLMPDVVTETPQKPLPKGYFEVHARTVVQEEQECVVIYPFTTRVEAGRLVLQSEDVELDCHFQGTFCGGDGCIDYHMEYVLDTRMDGEVLGYFAEPSASLHAFYFYDGETRIWWTGLPPQADNPFPEDDPMSFALADTATLVFPFEDGASANAPIGISIDQQMDIPQPNWEIVLQLD